MKEFSELIKNIEILRRLIREFFVFGYKSRNDYDKKSARTYDNEKRRIASYFAELFNEERDGSGKKVSILIDSDAIDSNPLYRLYKAKSFTDNDLVLHFIILDTLRDLEGANAFDISNYIDKHYGIKDDSFDLGTIRGKLNEYVELGLLSCNKDGSKLIYRLADDFDGSEIDWDMIYYFSEVDVLGIIGSYILDRKDDFSPMIKFKHRQLFAVIDSYYLILLLDAIKQHKKLCITRKSEADNVRKSEITTRAIIPLKILINRQNGRQYLAAYDYIEKVFLNYRLDHITEIEYVNEYLNEEQFCQLRNEIDERLHSTWNVNFFANKNPQKVELIVRVEKGEEFVVTRLKREGHGGEVAQIAEDRYLYRKSVYDPSEMIPWVKSFIGRIVSFTSEDKAVEEQFNNDLKHIMEEWLNGN